MMSLSRNLMQWIVAFSILVLAACGGDKVAGGTVVDPNTMATYSSASAADDPTVDPDIGTDVVDPGDGPSIEPVDDPSHSVIVDPMGVDVCEDEDGNNICKDSLFDDFAKLYYESEHCKVKINEGVASYMYFDSDDGRDSSLVGYLYFQVGMVYFNGDRSVRIEESIRDIGHDVGEGSIIVRTDLGSGSEICSEVLDGMNSLAQTRMDSLDVWGVSGGLSRWSDSCDKGALNLFWREAILPVADQMDEKVDEIRTYLNKKAEQYKKDCERWENMKRGFSSSSKSDLG